MTSISPLRSAPGIMGLTFTSNSATDLSSTASGMRTLAWVEVRVFAPRPLPLPAMPAQVVPWPLEYLRFRWAYPLPKTSESAVYLFDNVLAGAHGRAVDCPACILRCRSCREIIASSPDRPSVISSLFSLLCLGGCSLRGSCWTLPDARWTPADVIQHKRTAVKKSRNYVGITPQSEINLTKWLQRTLVPF